jgi:3-oxoacid CoA-transferase subunit A/glutaconate CoA-transferase subunit A
METLEVGKGELLAWYDPEEHREWVRKNKSLSMEDKVMDLREAVSKFVQDGSYISLGGFGHVRVSMAAIYEIIRENKKNLVVSGKTAVHDLDCLIAAGSVSKVEVAYSFGHELRGLSPASRRAVENGQVKAVTEWSNAAFQWRFKAAACGLPWIPSYVLLGTDTFRYSAAKVVKDPFTGRPICLIPACFPDVAIIHVHRCDKYGNSQIDGSLVEDFELARAAKRLIITAEEVIPNEKIRDHPWRTSIPYFYVDAVVEVPYGCHPCNMPTHYYFDEEHISEYLMMTQTDEGTKQYFDKYVYGVDDFKQYLELIGGVAKLNYLKKLEQGNARFVYPWTKL